MRWPARWSRLRPLLVGALALVLVQATPAAAQQQPAPTPPQQGRRAAAPAPNLDALTATFLGNGGGVDRPGAIDFGRDRGVVAAGQVSGSVAGPSVDLGGTSGAVIRLDAAGRTVRSVTRIGTVVDDMEVIRRTGGIAVTGDFGVAVLDASASRVDWQHTTCARGRGRRIAAGENGAVAVLCSGTVTVFDQGGGRVATFKPDHRVVEDVAVVDTSGLVVVTGHDVTLDRERRELRVAYLDAYDVRGRRVWRAYGWSGEQIPGFTAGTRGIRVARGHDGRVYLLGEADGAANAFRALPQDAQRPGRLTGHDAYDSLNPDRAGDARGPLVFVTRLNAENGRQIAGRFALARTPDGRPAPTYGRAVAADAYGNVVVGGAAQCCLPQRQNQRVGGRPVPPSQSLDAYVLSLDAGLADRRAWTAVGRGGEVQAVATLGGVAALAAAMTTRAVVTLAPLPGQGRPSGSVSERNPDGYLATWRSPEHAKHPPGLTAEQITAEAEAKAQAATARGEQPTTPAGQGAAGTPAPAPDGDVPDANAAAAQPRQREEPQGNNAYLLVTVILIVLAALPAAISSARRRWDPP